MRTFIFLFILGLLSATPALAQKKVAMVKLIRGDVDILTLGKTAKLKADDWVEEGAVVKTAGKSFVKLMFIDKSQMNVGPNSEMKIENYSGKDSGVIDLVKGKIRSQVTKDYLQMDKDKSKLFIKTKNAVMGVRGTDFMIATDGTNSSVILFEGEVVFNKLNGRSDTSSSAGLEQIVDRGVRMFPGEFSVVEQSMPQPTVPSLLNIQQREALEKNDSFDANREPSNDSKKDEVVKSVVPGGLSGEVVSNNSETLRKEAPPEKIDGADKRVPSSSNPNGYVDGHKVKPVNGSTLDLEKMKIYPPSKDRYFDSHSNTYIGSGTGTINEAGEFVPTKTLSQDTVVMQPVALLPPPIAPQLDPMGVILSPPPPPLDFKQQYQQVIPPVTNTTINVSN